MAIVSLGLIKKDNILTIESWDDTTNDLAVSVKDYDLDGHIVNPNAKTVDGNGISYVTRTMSIAAAEE